MTHSWSPICPTSAKALALLQRTIWKYLDAECQGQNTARNRAVKSRLGLFQEVPCSALDDTVTRPGRKRQESEDLGWGDTTLKTKSL